MHVDVLDKQKAGVLQLPEGSGVVSQCRSPSLSLIQPHRPSSKEQLKYPDAEENKSHWNSTVKLTMSCVGGKRYKMFCHLFEQTAPAR